MFSSKQIGQGKNISQKNLNFLNFIFKNLNFLDFIFNKNFSQKENVIGNKYSKV